MLVQASAEVPDSSDYRPAATLDEATPASYDNAAPDSGVTAAKKLLYAEGHVRIACRPIIVGIEKSSAFVHITGAAMNIYLTAVHPNSVRKDDPAEQTNGHAAAVLLSIPFDEIVLHATTTTQNDGSSVPGLYLHIEPTEESAFVKLADALRSDATEPTADAVSAAPVLELTLTPIAGSLDTPDAIVQKMYAALTHMANTLPPAVTEDIHDAEENEESIPISFFRQAARDAAGGSEDLLVSGRWITAENADHFMDAAEADPPFDSRQEQ